MSHFREVTPSFAASPQISLADVTTAASEGYTSIICNRPDGEDAGQLSGADIAAACVAHGISFVHVPIVGAISHGQVVQMAAAIEASNGPVLAYCRSGTRSTNVWAMAMAINGENPDDLVACAARAGYDLNGLLPSLRALGAR